MRSFQPVLAGASLVFACFLLVRRRKHIKGVEKVDNQIEVLPPSPIDDSLRLIVYRAIYGYPVLEKYALGVQKPSFRLKQRSTVT